MDRKNKLRLHRSEAGQRRVSEIIKGFQRRVIGAGEGTESIWKRGTNAIWMTQSMWIVKVEGR